MADLIPIGTINRAPTENNASAVPNTVEKTARSKSTSEQGAQRVFERRKSGDRRRARADRRYLEQNSRQKLLDRRKSRDRRLISQSSDTGGRGRLTRQRGGIIDELV